MPTESKRAVWVERMAEYTASGLSQKRWCEQNDIPLHQFAYWRQRLNAAATGGQGTTGGDVAGVEWCGVQVTGSATAPALSVYIGPARVAVEPGFDAGHLRAVVETLVSALGSLTRDITC